jgi:hypothetical protein
VLAAREVPRGSAPFKRIQLERARHAHHAGQKPHQGIKGSCIKVRHQLAAAVLDELWYCFALIGKPALPLDR